MIFIEIVILISNSMICNDLFNYLIELYVFYDFHYSGTEFYDFHDFHESRIEFYDCYYFPN